MYACIISKIPRKIKEKCIFSQSADLNFKFFPFCAYHGATPRNHWAKQTQKKLNLWGKMAVDKSAWIKACTWQQNWYMIKDNHINHNLQKQCKIKYDLMMMSLEHEDYFFRSEAQFFWNPQDFSIRNILMLINNSKMSPFLHKKLDYDLREINNFLIILKYITWNFKASLVSVTMARWGKKYII